MTGGVSVTNPYVSLPTDFLSTYSLAVIDGTGSYNYLINKDVNFLREAYPNPTSTGLPKYYAIFGPQYTDPTALSLILGPTPDTNYNVELHYFFYPPSIIPGIITGFNNLTSVGTGYTTGTYYNVPLTNGTGANATANIKISGGVVTSVTLETGGSGYTVGDTLTALNSNLGGTGSGFAITVAAINNAIGQSWLGDNFDTVLLYGVLMEAAVFMKSEEDTVKLIDAKFKEALGQAKRLGDGLEKSDQYRNGQYRVKPQ